MRVSAKTSRKKVLNVKRHSIVNNSQTLQNQTDVQNRHLEIEKDKYFALWAGIIFFMVIIMIGWFFKFRSNVMANVVQNSNGNGLTDMLVDFNNAFDKTLHPAKESTANPIPKQTEVLQQHLDEIKEKIELNKFLYTLNNELRDHSAVSE